MSADTVELLVGGDYDCVRMVGHQDVREASGLEVRLNMRPTPHDAFDALTHSDAGDGGELSLSFCCTIASQRAARRDFVVLPVFFARAFRHGNILVNAHANITAPADLRGKVIGVPEYGMTMAVWVRGVLADHYGIQPEEMSWRVGRAPVALEQDVLKYPKDVQILSAPSGDLLRLLRDGELDALISRVPAKLPSNVLRLFPNYAQVEREYFRATAIFPIMHTLVLRRSVHERDPLLSRRLFDACVRAKDVAVADLERVIDASVPLPGLAPMMEENIALMRGDLWPYGISRNLTTLQTFLRYALEQGLLWDEMSADEIFLDLE